MSNAFDVDHAFFKGARPEKQGTAKANLRWAKARRTYAIAAGWYPVTPTRLFFDGIRYWNYSQILSCQSTYSVVDTVKKLGY
jgi:hypothetical protein